MHQSFAERRLLDGRLTPRLRLAYPQFSWCEASMSPDTEAEAHEAGLVTRDVDQKD